MSRSACSPAPSSCALTGRHATALETRQANTFPRTTPHRHLQITTCRAPSIDWTSTRRGRASDGGPGVRRPGTRTPANRRAAVGAAQQSRMLMCPDTGHWNPRRRSGCVMPKPWKAEGAARRTPAYGPSRRTAGRWPVVTPRRSISSSDTLSPSTFRSSELRLASPDSGKVLMAMH